MVNSQPYTHAYIYIYIYPHLLICLPLYAYIHISNSTYYLTKGPPYYIDILLT